MTEHSERFYGLDHLRALAIVLVIMYHYRAFKHPVWIETVGKFGWTGVDLFFVLSGFLISGPLLKEIENKGSMDPKIFYIKRFFRIIPSYTFTLVVYFTLPFFREREALPPLWKLITFTQNFGLDVINRGTFSHAWSLCIEEQFYLFLPLLLLGITRLKKLKYLPYLLISVVIFSMILRLVMWNKLVVTADNNPTDFWREWYMNIYYPTYTRLDGLGIGVLIGYLMQYSSECKKMVHHHGNKLGLTGILMLAVSCWMCNEQASETASVFGFTMVAVSYGLIVLAAVSGASRLARSKFYVTTELAALSYSIYLSHKGIIHMAQNGLEHFGYQTSDTVSLFICLAACVLGGIFYRVLIEKPFAGIKYRVLNARYK
ncbi:acyltransferase [Chryseobacterium sp.]|uniref:acyltransferase family protein n=1 Tax=Chryseobacterium sp. TaxID=1871047 RepID=UPI0025C27843|nr:acyltransferase [Chryseobacterium sp.]MBV8325125.1 acyltransferase [Chryseobacterium sp.]